VPVLELAFVPDCLLDQTGTGHQKSLAKKAKPVLKRAYARTKTGTRSKTGSARTSTGILLIRVLTDVLNNKQPAHEENEKNF